MVKRLFVAILILLVGCSAFAASETDEAIHQELRDLLHGIENAINSQKYIDLEPYFDEKMRVTTINQEVLLSRSEIGGYFKKWFGPSGYLKKLRMTLTPDALTEFYGNKTIGIVIGSGDEDYILADGRNFDLKTRWTATVIKGSDGKWRILALHIGTNFLDNPILTKAEAALIYFAGGGLIGGLLIGGLICFVLMRRKKT